MFNTPKRVAFIVAAGLIGASLMAQAPVPPPPTGQQVERRGERQEAKGGRQERRGARNERKGERKERRGEHLEAKGK